MRNPRPICPDPACVNHADPPASFYIKKGYRTKANGKRVPRYQCRDCGKHFSASQTRPQHSQHRPELNEQIYKLAASGVSMRRLEKTLGCSKRTIANKIRYLARQAEAEHAKFMADPANHTAFAMMDELETFIHARYKQVSVPVVIRVKTGEILGFDVARIPSSMKLGGAGGDGEMPAGGTRWTINERPRVLPELLARIAPMLKENAMIATDGEASYPKWIARRLPGVTHAVRRSPKERGLGRKTWTTTKTIEGLRQRLWLYVAWTNGYRLK